MPEWLTFTLLVPGVCFWGAALAFPPYCAAEIFNASCCNLRDRSLSIQVLVFVVALAGGALVVTVAAAATQDG